MKFSLNIAIVFCFFSATWLRAENWPGFRGPTYQGLCTETGLPLHWSENSNILWKAKIKGEGWSSPIVWGDRVFLTTATENGQSCRVLSIEAHSGQILWDKEVFQQVPRHKQERNSFATPTPATDGKRVYVCFGDGSFAALDFESSLIWTNRGYKFYGEHGLGSSPILYRDLLIMARDGSSEGEDKKLGWQKPWDQSCVLALDAKTGKERWKGQRGLSRISHGVPTIWEHNGGAEVISEAGDVVQGFDVKTGQRVWSSEVIGEGKVPSTVIGDGLAFTAGGWGGKESIKAFRLGGKGDLKESNLVWEQKKGMPKVPSMIYVKPHLFAITDGGVATCMNAQTGELLWQERVGGNFSASPVSAEGRIYFLGDNGETTVIEAGAEFKVLAKNPLGEKVQASIAVSEGRFFIRAQNNIFCIGSGESRPDGLTGYWKFDETSSAEIKDSSGHQNDGRLLGAIRVSGKAGQAIDCQQDALVEVPHTPSLDDFNDGLTVSAWVNRDADSTWNMIVSREIKDGPSEYFGLAVVKNKALFSIDPDGTQYKNIKSDADIPTGEWVHLAGTFDNGTFKLFVNGHLIKSGTGAGPLRFDDQNPLIIGGNSNTQGKNWVDCFHGRIDEVRLYHRALSEIDLLAICNLESGQR